MGTAINKDIAKPFPIKARFADNHDQVRLAEPTHTADSFSPKSGRAHSNLTCHHADVASEPELALL